MRLDFNALWVDDQPVRVDAQIVSIKAKMAAEGFEFIPRRCTTIAQMEQAISDSVFTDEIDLILVDWDLGNGIHGEDAIERIRRVVHYKDVVFYSAHASVDLRQKAFDKGLEGVYFSSRIELVDEVVGIFESLIKKVLDLDHTRGIVMGATSDIDHIVISCLTLAHEKLDNMAKAEFVKDALSRVAKKIDNLTELGKKLQARPTVKALFKAHMLITSDDRLQLLEGVLGMPLFAVHSPIVTKVASYRDGVIKGRNKLGHVVLVPKGRPNKVTDGTGEEVDINEMRDLRKLILSLRADFRTLLDAMRV